MARARNIKPGFFKNEELADLPAEVRLLFIGLWTLADREGRLEDRPRRIKAELFPFDSFEVDSMLNQLQTSSFLIRYEVSGERFIQVVNFVKHQDPHYKEKASEITPPPGVSNLITATNTPRETRARILQRDEYRCRECGSEEYLSIDHVVPVSRGGTGEDSNLQVLCLKCNRAKGNKLPGEKKGARRSTHDDTSLRTRINVESTTTQVRTDVDSSSIQVKADAPGSIPLIPDSLIPDSLIPESKRAERSQGSRLDSGWQLPDDWREVALALRPEWKRHDVNLVADNFRDHWLSTPGAKGVKSDWLATWRKWVRTDAHRGGVVNGKRPTEESPYDRAAREKMERDCPRIAAKAPRKSEPETVEMEPIHAIA